MFKDLRDRAVVLADLSLENANVFYELGIRHVMSPSGTVLICRKGTTLPFDVGHQRVIFYNFDGAALDWEEVENTVKTLKLALQEAAKNEMDSPVYALLPHVLRFNGSECSLRKTTSRTLSDTLIKYQRGLARTWLDGHVKMSTLLDEHSDDDFGLRAIGYYCLECLDAADVIRVAPGIASLLAKAAQYDLATEIYGKLKTANKLAGDDLLQYAAAYAENCPDIQCVNTAIGYVQEVLGASQSTELSGGDPAPSDKVVAFGYGRLGSLLQKKWELTENKTDLEQAMDAYSKALDHMQSARNRGAFRDPGKIAHTRLKLLTLRRKHDRGSKRQDYENHRGEILKIVERRDDDPVSVSYLHWAQAIALADMNETDKAREIIDRQIVEDVELASKSLEVRGRQYVTIRYFLERYQDTLTNVGVISDRLRASLRS
jgi:tetratricopeptide (TPR) repeat protein